MAYEQLVSVSGSAPNNSVPTADGMGGYSWSPQQGGGGSSVGIQSVEQTTTSTEDSGINVVTVTMTDGKTSTFEVRNGSKGSTGAQGKPGSAGTDGKSAYQYAVEGGYTGTEAEFTAKLAEEMPTTLPNPNALTFTGAVTGSYDGSEELTVEIPSGGGGGEIWRTVAQGEITVDDSTEIEITLDSDGNAFALKEFELLFTNKWASNTGVYIVINGASIFLASGAQNYGYRMTRLIGDFLSGTLRMLGSNAANTAITTNPIFFTSTNPNNTVEFNQISGTGLTSLKIYPQGTNTLVSGSKYELKGVDV